MSEKALQVDNEIETAQKLSRSHPLQAVAAIEALMQKEEILHDRHLMGLLEYELGNAWFILADSSHALEHLSNACTLLKEAGDWENFSHAESLIGITFMNQGNMASAMQIFSEEVTLSVKNQKTLSLYKAECILGQCFFYSGLYEKSLYYFERAQKLLEKNPSFYQETESIPIALAVTILAQSELHQFENAEKTSADLKKVMMKGSRFENGPFSVIPECWLHCRKKDKNADVFISAAVRTCLDASETSGDCLMILSQFALFLAELHKWGPLEEMIVMLQKILKGKDYYKVLMDAAWAKCQLMHATGRNEEAYHAMQAYADASLKSQQSAVTSGLLYLQLKKDLETISEENAQLKTESSTDELTGLANRRGMNHLLYENFEKARKERKILIIGIMDVDLFKQINDKFGHQEGDRCLKLLGQVLLSIQNDHLHAARYGGDEFVLIGYDMQKEEMQNTAMLIQKRLKQDVKEFGCIPITISQGYYGKIPEALDTEWNYLTQADQALYQAKQKHHGEVCIRV